MRENSERLLAMVSNLLGGRPRAGSKQLDLKPVDPSRGECRRCDPCRAQDANIDLKVDSPRAAGVAVDIERMGMLRNF